MAIKGKDANKKVFEGLKKLEYRGYDSCGIGCKVDGEIKLYKAIGYIENLEKTNVLDNSCNIAIGHTRWATHGGVTVNNSHPHSSQSGAFSLVHNGIIENYLELRDKYFKDEVFTSDTDSEVIAHLIEYYYNGDILVALQKTIKELRGSFAIVLVSKYDDALYFARSSSPLVLGVDNDVIGLSSDIGGFKNKSKVCYIPDNCFGKIDTEIIVFDKNNNYVEVEYVDMGKFSLSVDKGKFSHYMIKEIMEIPKTLKQTYDEFMSGNFKLPDRIDNVVVIGCGTSYHSGLMMCKYIEQIAGIRAECKIASEFIYNHLLLSPHTLMIFISQSGETADTLAAIKRVKNLGVYTLAVTNVRGSTITTIADEVLYINVGSEICVASTKAYTSQVFIGLLLSLSLRELNNGGFEKCGVCVNVYGNDIKNSQLACGLNFEKMFDIDISKIYNEVKNIVYLFDNKNELHLIGKDYDYITAMEGALKIKEVSYMFTDAYPCGELKHGTLSLIENNSVVIAVATCDGILLDKTQNAMCEISARGGKCVVISQMNKDVFSDHLSISIPSLDDLLMPIISIIPLDLIAYEVSVSRGINPDKPRNLAKSVTVE